MNNSKPVATQMILVRLSHKINFRRHKYVTGTYRDESDANRYDKERKGSVGRRNQNALYVCLKLSKNKLN